MTFNELLVGRGVSRIARYRRKSRVGSVGGCAVFPASEGIGVSVSVILGGSVVGGLFTFADTGCVYYAAVVHFPCYGIKGSDSCFTVISEVNLLIAVAADEVILRTVAAKSAGEYAGSLHGNLDRCGVCQFAADIDLLAVCQINIGRVSCDYRIAGYRESCI